MRRPVRLSQQRSSIGQPVAGADGARFRVPGVPDLIRAKDRSGGRVGAHDISEALHAAIFFESGESAKENG